MESARLRWGIVASAVLLALVALLVGAPSALSDDDEQWRLRLEKHLRKVEVSTTELDQQPPSGKTLLDRVLALHVRVKTLETAAELQPGTIRGEDDLSYLSMDLAMLETRLRAVRAARVPKKEAPPVPTLPADKPKADDDPKPEDKPKPDGKAKGDGGRSPAAAKWPDEVRFLATAKIVYSETGEWFLTKYQRSGLGNDFLMDGYKGTLSFSVRMANLKQDVRGVVVRVGIRMKHPFGADGSGYKVYDVRWNASNRVLGNESLKSWVNHDVVTSSGPIQWIAKPREVNTPLDAEAYVVSAVLQSGEEITFETPKFGAK